MPLASSWPVWASLARNAALFAAKLACFLATGSLAVAASCVDSTADLLAQGLLALAANATRNGGRDPRYPVGKARLEAVAVIVVAAFYAAGAGEVFARAVARVVTLARGGAPDSSSSSSSSSSSYPPRLPSQTALTLAALAAIVLLKLILFLACWLHRARSATVAALALDHVSDAATNAVALVASLLSGTARGQQLCGGPAAASFVDPVGAAIIALAVAFAWGLATWDHVTKLIGRHASAAFVGRVREVIARESAGALVQVDALRCYHAGENVLVEVEVVVPPETPVRVAHDVGLAMQDEIERMPEVERAFVHVDYERRRTPEHRADRERGGGLPRGDEEENEQRRPAKILDPTAARAARRERARRRRLGSNLGLECEAWEEPAFDTYLEQPMLDEP